MAKRLLNLVEKAVAQERILRLIVSRGASHVRPFRVVFRQLAKGSAKWPIVDYVLVIVQPVIKMIPGSPF